VRGPGVSTSCKQVAPGVGHERGQMLHAETFTSLHPCLVSRSGWRKLSSPLLVEYKAELGRGPRSSWRCCASRGVCTGGE